VAAAAGTASLARRLPRPAIAWAGLVVLGLANAAAVQARHADWSSSDALFEAGVEAAPRSAKAQYNAAWAAFERGDVALAEARAREAARLHADYPEAHALLGGVLDLTGRTAEAEAEFAVALSAARTRGAPPSDLALHHATFLARHGRYEEALAAVSAQRAIDPEDPRLADLEARVRARAERR
jgi:Flp pilus assembly protein TadD